VTRLARRYFFSDEEPELDSPSMQYGYEETRNLCSWCGQAGHSDVWPKRCPHRPPPIVL
jgi:hypothetical protein